jgi:hypothetical protein
MSKHASKSDQPELNRLALLALVSTFSELKENMESLEKQLVVFAKRFCKE